MKLNVNLSPVVVMYIEYDAGLREENKEIRIKLSIVQRSCSSACATQDTLEVDLIKVRKHFDTLREQTLLSLIHI